MAGRLLPQDPHDDPADLLLSQIAEDREAASAAVKKRSMRNTRVGRAPKIKENPA